MNTTRAEIAGREGALGLAVLAPPFLADDHVFSTELGTCEHRLKPYITGQVTPYKLYSGFSDSAALLTKGPSQSAENWRSPRPAPSAEMLALIKRMQLRTIDNLLRALRTPARTGGPALRP